MAIQGLSAPSARAGGLEDRGVESSSARAGGLGHSRVERSLRTSRWARGSAVRTSYLVPRTYLALPYLGIGAGLRFGSGSGSGPGSGFGFGSAALAEGLRITTIAHFETSNHKNRLQLPL